ncbi:MAG: flagellar FlbD family protein [Oscillospiraceae bacterium]
MINVTRINKVEKYWINEEMIEFIEETPDTIISLESGKKVSVAESAEEVIRLMKEQRIEILNKSWINR